MNEWALFHVIRKPKSVVTVKHSSTKNNTRTGRPFIWRHNATSNLIKVTHWLYDSSGNKISASFSSDINTQHDDLRSYMTWDNSYLIIPGFLVTVGLDRTGVFFNPFCLLKRIFFFCMMFVQGEFKRMLKIQTFRKSFFLFFHTFFW